MKSLYWMRPWNIRDAEFILKFRNDPDYMRYYRQDAPISLKKEREFIKNSHAHNYNAYILMYGDEPLGMFALHGSELCVVAPFKYHEMGIKALLSFTKNTLIHADIFSWNTKGIQLLIKLGFDIYGVQEKYCKKNGAWNSAIKLML